MALQVVTPTPNRLTSYTRSDDNVARTTAMSTAVNPPDEAIARGVVWLDQNKLSITLDDAAIYALLNEALTDYDAHRQSAVFHAIADGTNAVSVVPVADIQTAITRTNLLRTALLAHMNNSGGAYHTVADAVNIAALSAVPACSDVPTLVTLLRAIKEYFNTHLSEPGVHPVDDGVNAITNSAPIAGTVTGTIGIAGDFFTTGETILGTVGPVVSLSEHTFNGPIVSSGPTAYRRLRHQSHGSLGANTTIDLDNDLHSFSDPSVASVDVEVDMSAAVDSVLRCYSTAAAPANTIVFKYSGITLITFPPAANRAWVDFRFNGLLPEITAYGGGATP